MNWNIFNVLVILGVIQGIFLSSTIFLNKKYKSKTNTYLALVLVLMSLTNLEYWLIDTNLSKKNIFLEYFFIPFQHLIAPMMFLYSASYIGNTKTSKKHLFLIYLPFSIFTVCHLFLLIYHLFFNKSTFFISKKSIHTFYIIEEIVSISISIYFIAYTFLIIKEYKKTINEVNTEWITRILYLSIIVLFLWVATTFSGVFSSLDLINYLLWISVSFVIYWIGYSGLNQYIINKQRAYIKKSNNNIRKREVSEDNPIFIKFKILIFDDKLYKNPEVSLNFIAEEIGITSSYLSQIINKVTNKSFTEYINSYRIEEVKKMLLNPEFDKYNILSIGYEAGFNSKTVFYTTFKKQTGLTPNQFKKQNRNIINT